MKSFLQLLSFGFVATCTSASSLVQGRQDIVYSLTVATKSDNALDGGSIEILDSVLGVYTGDRAAAEVFPITNEKTGLSSLHTYPIGIVDHVLGLKGDNGLYSLVDIVNVGDGTVGSHYGSFIWENGIVMQDLPGGWVAFPSGDGWLIKWYEGNMIVTQDYVAVDILYKAVKSR